jgi:putative DNA primase/helicase
LAATKNGTLNLRDNTFYNSQQEDFLTKQLGTYYDETADCPRWKQFLNEVFNNDAEMINFVQRVVGYALTGDISEQVMFILYGFGKNGKGVFINTISKLLNDYAGTASFKTFDADKQSEQTNDLAMLNGKRFVAMSESAADKRLNEPLIKQVTGGDKISCRFLRKEFFEYLPQFKLFLATNHKPIITQSDFGIWRRIVLIPFTQNFDGREDKYLEQKLTTELAGILNWALEGLNKWSEIGLKFPQSVIEANQKYRNDSDTIQQWLDIRTRTITGGMVKSSSAYSNYKHYCEENGYIGVGNRTMKSALEEKGFKLVKRTDANYYDGFEIVTG